MKPLESFQGSQKRFDSSIFLVRSQSPDQLYTVTVAVKANRNEESDILESLFSKFPYGKTRFTPFGENNLARLDGAWQEERKQLIEEHTEHLTAFSHDRDRSGNRNSDEIQAVHSALLVQNHLPVDEDTVVLVHGSSEQASPFVNAYSGLNNTNSPPPTAHCIKADAYYPTALLGRITAFYLAKELERGNHSGLPVEVREMKQKYPSKWAAAQTGRVRDEISYTPEVNEDRRGNHVPDRAHCWYRGAVSLHADANAISWTREDHQQLIQYVQSCGHYTLGTYFKTYED